MGGARAAEGPRDAVRPRLGTPRTLAFGFRSPADARRQRVSLLSRAQPPRARARRVLRRRSRGRAGTRGDSSEAGHRALRDAQPLHAPALVLGAGRLGGSALRRGIPEVHGSRGRRPGPARETLGDAERARRASAGGVPRRRDPSGKARIPRGGPRLRAHASRPRRGRGRDPRARPRRADRHRAQHARVRPRPRRPHSRPPPRARRRPPLQHGSPRGHRHRRPRLVVSRGGPDARADPGAAGRQRLRRRELLQPRAHPIPRPAGCGR